MNSCVNGPGCGWVQMGRRASRRGVAVAVAVKAASCTRAPHPATGPCKWTSGPCIGGVGPCNPTKTLPPTTRSLHFDHTHCCKAMHLVQCAPMDAWPAMTGLLVGSVSRMMTHSRPQERSKVHLAPAHCALQLPILITKRQAGCVLPT